MSDEDEDKDSNTAKNDGATERSSYLPRLDQAVRFPTFCFQLGYCKLLNVIIKERSRLFNSS